MKKTTFGTMPCGKTVDLYTLKNDVATLAVMTRGATIVRFATYGTDIVGGFDTLQDYIEDTSHQGAIIGRVANRVANARFTMNRKVYRLPNNDNGNCLHGGDGFDHKIWDVTAVAEDRITLRYVSTDGEEGFPSRLTVSVTYVLSGATLMIDYTATPEGETPIALTNHAYFNLNGFGTNVENHLVRIYADSYTEVDEDLIPNGNRPNVRGTVFDFTEPHTIGERLSESFDGYDHNYILNGEKKDTLFGHTLALAAEVWGDRLQMSVYTDQPGVQFYIGNFLTGKPNFRDHVKKSRHGAFCLETQTEPNCINHSIGFYGAGQTYRHTTVYAVSEKS